MVIKEKRMNSVHTCVIGFSLLLALFSAAVTAADDSGSRVYIEKVGVFLVLPKGYSLEQNSRERNRRGSFACYDFITEYNPNIPALQEIQFFSKKSIKRFEDACAKCEDCGGEDFCVTGEYPTTAEYDWQGEALKNPRKSNTKHQLKRFGNKNFIVSDHKHIGGVGFYREYRTFLNNIMVAVWIHWENKSQAKAADRLFAALKIVEQ
jgi:hypothetical protein